MNLAVLLILTACSNRVASSMSAAYYEFDCVSETPITFQYSIF